MCVVLESLLTDYDMGPDLKKPGTILQSKIFSIMHYKTIVKMRYFKKNLLKFSNGHIHLILGPILKNWAVLFLRVQET